MESLLHFIWNYRLIKPVELFTAGGTRLKIIHPGELNKDSGPDFFNSRLEIDGVTLAGNVEIHVNSSDWLKHKHQDDKTYNNIILHVVYNHDRSIQQNTQHNVEVFELKNYLCDSILDKYETLVKSDYTLPCSRQIGSVETVKLQSWLQRMLVERLEKKTESIKTVFRTSGNDHAQTLYFLLARNFGFKVNSEPFELLAKNLPLRTLMKHSGNLFQLEALLFGCAGFLEKQYRDKYPQQLQNEFEFLKTKYKLKQLDVSLWKFLRLRPANFPTVRLWQFATMIHKCPELFSSPWEFSSLKKLQESVSFPHEGYWRSRYRLEGSELKVLKGIGKNSLENILINTIAPFLFFYGRQSGNERFADAALDCFESIGFEDNYKVRHFIAAGLKPKTAGESQALMQLFDNYCKNKSCLSCAVAANLLLNK